MTRFARLDGQSEKDVAQIVSMPAVRDRLGDRTGEIQQVTRLGSGAYRIDGTAGAYVMRFPGDEDKLRALRREERVRRGLQRRVAVRVPDTTVIDDVEGCPVFALHSLIAGDPLETETLERQSPEGYECFVGDLVRFFCQTHAVPMDVACDWLGLPFEGERTRLELVSERGKPTWFGPEAVAEMRPRVLLLLDEGEAALLADTVRRFEALERDPAWMVFGHGDMHGYNMAVAEDAPGLRLVGVFDLECTGILDIHEDLFRLSLVSEALLDRVIEAYQCQAGWAWRIDRERVAIYYRAFLFYLMDGKSGEPLTHLKRLLQAHLAYCGRAKGRGEGGKSQPG